MWKLLVGFVVFAAISLYVIFQAGDKVDMSGEKHGTETTHSPGSGTPAGGPAPAASAAKP